MLKKQGASRTVRRFSLFRRFLCAALLLSISALLSLTGAGVYAQPEAYDQPYTDIYPMAADPDTSRFAEQFSPSTLENGRLWTDKSVSVEHITYYDIQGHPLTTIHSDKDEFLVSLSALSQSYSIETIIEPTDAVFVLDVSASMYVYQLGGVPRSVVMIGALNDAVHMLMDANPENRVAVVAYGGSAQGGGNVTRSNELLTLGHYDLNKGDDYFSINMSGTQITVSSQIANAYVPSRTVDVDGGTPTQRGIYEGAKILYENTDTQFSSATAGGTPFTVTRRPVMVLLTDGDPTFGWRDYTIGSNSTANGFDCGNGNPANGDMGVDLLTVATASYWKQQVHDHYYGPQRMSNAMGFYTIGVGVSGIHAPAVMDPANHAAANTQAFNGTAYNMKTLLDEFVSGSGSITFPVFNKGSNTVRALATIANTNGYVKSYDYTDGYYPADDSDALNDAFQSITSEIISKGNYTTDVGGSNPDFGGYLIMSDVIGDHMQFKESKGLFANGVMNTGRSLAKEAAQGSASADWESIVDVISARLGVNASTTEAIINGSIAGGAIYYNSDDDCNCIMRWYADDRTEFVGLYYDESGKILPPPGNAMCMVELYPMSNEVYDEVAGDYTSLIYSFLSVTTALTEDEFGLKGVDDITIPLFENQQLVRWYIPASLIPLRTVSEKFDGNNPDVVSGLEIKEVMPIFYCYTIGLETPLDMDTVSDNYKACNANPSGTGYYFYSNDWRWDDGTEDFHDTTLAVFDPNTSNPYYYFSEDTPLYIKQGDQYEEAASYSPNQDYYVKKQYFDENAPGYLSYLYVLVNTNVTNIAVDQSGAPYVPMGEHKKISIVIVPKSDNLTGSYDFSLDADLVGSTELYLLGNNGRIEVDTLTSISVRKVWKGAPQAAVWVQLYADGEPLRAPVKLNAANNWRYTWAELMMYAQELNADGDVPLNIYTVREGAFEDGVFTPFGELNGKYTVSYVQPAWDDTARSWSEAVVTNRYDSAPEDEGGTDGDHGDNGDNGGNGGNGGNGDNGGNGGNGNNGDNTQGGNIPPTGDDSNMILLVLLVSGLAATLAFLGIRKSVSRGHIT
jgi:uncharacterized protein YegL